MKVARKRPFHLLTTAPPLARKQAMAQSTRYDDSEDRSLTVAGPIETVNIYLVPVRTLGLSDFS